MLEGGDLMRGKKRLSPSEQILRHVEQTRDFLRDAMQLTTFQGRDITNAQFVAWDTLNDVAQYIRALLRDR